MTKILTLHDAMRKIEELEQRVKVLENKKPAYVYSPTDSSRRKYIDEAIIILTGSFVKY